jgi:hypothetical protein
VTNLLFGDDLQTKLTRIRATNKIGNTTNPSHAPSQSRIYKPKTRSPVVQTTGEQQQAGSEPWTEPSLFRANKEIDLEVIHKLSQIQVSEYESLVPSLIKYFEYKVANFKAGQLSTSYFAWKELTSDPEILEAVSGQRIEFNQNPVQLNLPVQPNYSYQQGQFIDSEIQNLLNRCHCRIYT